MIAIPAEYPHPMAEEEPQGPEPETDDKALSEDELQGIVTRTIEDAILFIESDIAPIRAKATEYLRGLPFGDEEEGRSQVISRDVHDTIAAITPSLLRVFFGPERVVEFVPTGPDDVEMAEEVTDYINYIFTKDNPGFLILHSLFKDSLARKTGIAKYWWDKSVEVTVSDYTGMDMMDLVKLREDMQQSGTDAEILNAEQKPDGTFDLRLKLRRPKDRVGIAALPPEEFFIDKGARSLDEFTVVGHRREMALSDLVAMGYDEDELEESKGEGGLADNWEKMDRLPVPTRAHSDETGNESQAPIVYVEAFLRIDTDGDGIAELHKFCCAGTSYKILKQEMVEAHCFADFPCDPEPHTFFGDSYAEKTMDVQKTKTGVLRAALDSLANTIFPRTVIGWGVDVADALNTEIGALIRADDVNAIKILDTPFIGKDSFPMLSYMDEVLENRTGMSKVSQGLDPGALQNTTALAAANQFGKAHEHIEMIARIFSETGMKRLFRGILRLVVQNQRQSRMVNLRGSWKKIDPRAWKTDMEVTTNVALGAGTDREKLQVLMQVKATQEQIILTAGPNNPLCTIQEYFNTLSKIMALTGFKNVETFFRDPSKQPPLPPAQPPPDPKAMADMAKQENEAKKLQLDFLIHQNTMAQKTADRDQEAILKIYEANLRNKTQVDVAHIRGAFETLRISADLHIQKQESMPKAQIENARD